MRVGIFLLLLLLLAGCGHRAGVTHNGQQSTSQPVAGGDVPIAGSVKLTLTADHDGGEWRVNLRAPQASDLYQVAGTLAFDAGKYSVVAVEAGGGLGQPSDSYFAGKELSPGRVAFGYTKRYWGPGANGDVWLVSLRVHPTGAFSLADFKLDPTAKLLARNSKKQPLAVDAGGAK